MTIVFAPAFFSCKRYDVKYHQIICNNNRIFKITAISISPDYFI